MPSAASRKSKVAVITGGSRGIGLAIATVFATNGFAVVISGLDEARLGTAVRTIGHAGVNGVRCDVANPDSVKNLFAKVREQLGEIHVLVNNAGVAHALSPIEQLSLEDWNKVIKTNLTGTFLCTQAALPLMSAGSTIVNNLSVAAVQPFAGMSAYNASKFGAFGFTNVLREEVRKRGIRVLALLPGAVDTEIWKQFWPQAPREKMISADTVAHAVFHAVSVPSEAVIEELRIGPTAGAL
jgi:NAD(P)-dependent dehydrogenase (short-subunit alcohol dehydrogenase family)